MTSNKKKMVERVEEFELVIAHEADTLISELKENHLSYGEIIDEINVNYGGAAYNLVLIEAKKQLKKEISEILVKENHW